MRKPSSIDPSIPEARFSECTECKFYRRFNTLKDCQGCEIGENFEEVVEELNPYNDRFLTGAFGGRDDE